MKKILIMTFAVFLISVVPASAQYTGGEGDGGASAVSQTEPAGLNDSESSFELAQPSSRQPVVNQNQQEPLPPLEAKRPAFSDGPQKEYYDSGKLKSVTYYAGGKKEGTAKFYSRDGKLTKEIQYRNDAMMSVKGFQKGEPGKFNLQNQLNPAIDFQALKVQIQDSLATATPYTKLTVFLSLAAGFLAVIGLVCLIVLADAHVKINLMGWIFVLCSLPGFLTYPIAAGVVNIWALSGVLSSVVGLLLGVGILMRSGFAKATAVIFMTTAFFIMFIYFLANVIGFVVASVEYSSSLIENFRFLMIVSCLVLISAGIFWRTLILPDVEKEFLKLGPKPDEKETRGKKS